MIRKCENVKIRTDLQTMGIYFVKHWLLKFMLEYENEQKDPDFDDDCKFSSFGTEFVTFVAKNQFKKRIVKPELVDNKDDGIAKINDSIAKIMNPRKMIRHEPVRCQVHILPKTADYIYLP